MPQAQSWTDQTLSHPYIKEAQGDGEGATACGYQSALVAGISSPLAGIWGSTPPGVTTVLNPRERQLK